MDQTKSSSPLGEASSFCSSFDASPKTPSSQASRATTASQILELFSPKQQVKKPSPPQDQSLSSDPLAPTTYPLIMKDKRRLRSKQRISYEISDDSGDELAPSTAESSFSTPEKPFAKRENIVFLTDDEEDDLAEVPPTPPPRLSTGGHSLRPAKSLSLSSHTTSYRPTKKMRSLGGSSNFSILTKKPRSLPKIQLEKNIARDILGAEEARKRAAFLVANKDLFLPLLPKQNYIQTLLEGRGAEKCEKDLSVPYEVLAEQPSGVKAVMKPYQMLGLSFLTYMHRNAASAILGDEMGLGKTLQTLAFLQQLKQLPKLTSSNDNPSLVLCPLSVLSSWMNEATKWTPGLNVIRFHGPVSERDRLKKMVAGEIDRYGNETKFARKRRTERRIAKEQPIIDSLLNDENDECQDAVDLVVTTYEGFLSEQNWFKRIFKWRYVILDEGHKIKNDVTLISKALQGLRAENRLILTGTPLQNNMAELWALFHWLYPDVFTEQSAVLFKDAFNLSKGRVDTGFMDHARHLLELVMLRRMKNSPGVDLNLPPKTEVLLFVPLSPMQKFYYLRLLTRADKGLLDEVFQGALEKENLLVKKESSHNTFSNGNEEESVSLVVSKPTTASKDWAETQKIMQQAINRENDGDQGTSAWRKLMNILMQLRKCCNHPYTLPNAAPDPYYLGDHVIHASAKFIILKKIIEELVLKQKKKILIFSGFTRMLDCCEDLLLLLGGGGEKFKYSRLDGASPRARRNLNIRLFNQEGLENQVMLISTKAGGLGINLAAATDIVLMDQDWNPQLTLQAESRAHRIGQKQPVTVYKLCTQGTVEEQMIGRIQKKLYLSAKVAESMRDVHYSSNLKDRQKRTAGRGTENAEDMPQLGTNELMSLVRRGAQTLAHPELDINEMLEWDWATTLERCRDKPADTRVSNDMTGGSVETEDEKAWLAQIEQVQSRVFEGKKHDKTSNTTSFGNIAQEWSRASRRVGKNTTVMVNGFAVSKESMNCGDWEAVPTLAGKDPRLSEPKRQKKQQFDNQDHCQCCWDAGELTLCSLCPRSYHYDCLDANSKVSASAKISFACSQHSCDDCFQKTTDAGGMLYRCRWCSRAYCEDCLNWDKTELLGDTIPEYEVLGFAAITQAFYIKCPKCTEEHETDLDADSFCKAQAQAFEETYEQWKKEKASEATFDEEGERSKLSDVPNLDDDETTLESSGIMTPDEDSEGPRGPSTRKRKCREDLRIQSKRPKRKTRRSA